MQMDDIFLGNLYDIEVLTRHFCSETDEAIDCPQTHVFRAKDLGLSSFVGYIPSDLLDLFSDRLNATYGSNVYRAVVGMRADRGNFLV
jgi:hypothetical protein